MSKNQMKKLAKQQKLKDTRKEWREKEKAKKKAKKRLLKGISHLLCLPQFLTTIRTGNHRKKEKKAGYRGSRISYDRIADWSYL